METTYTVLCRFDAETTKKNPRGKIIDISSILKVESTLKLSASNRCHNFHVDSPFKIEEISTKFPRRISTSNQWRINEDVSIGLLRYHQTPRKCCSITKLELGQNAHFYRLWVSCSKSSKNWAIADKKIPHTSYQIVKGMVQM